MAINNKYVRQFSWHTISSLWSVIVDDLEDDGPYIYELAKQNANCLDAFVIRRDACNSSIILELCRD